MASYMTDTTTHSFHGPATGMWMDTMQRVGAWRQRRASRARTARELATYTDRELFDLGISRGDIPAVINGTDRR